jgi:YidC/Oxa1 family membrane protein insertase
MDRNSIIGLSLIFLILISFYFINKPGAEEIRKQQIYQDSVALAQKIHREDSIKKLAAPAPAVISPTDSIVAAITDSVISNAKYGVFYSASTGTEKSVVMENERMRVKLSSKGGRVSSVELKDYKRYDQTSLVLFDGDSNKLEYIFTTTDGKTIHTGDLYFEPSSTKLEAHEGDSAILTMRANISSDRYIEQQYTLYGNTFKLGYKLNLVGLSQVIAAGKGLVLDWRMATPRQEKTKAAEEKTSTVYYKLKEEEADYVSETSDEQEVLEEPVHWISFKQQFFNATLVAENNFLKGTVASNHIPADSMHVKSLSAQMMVPVNGTDKEDISMYFYFGPNQYHFLAKLDIGLQKLLPLGWGIFGWVNRFAVIPIFNFLNQFTSSYGLIILLLTLIIKLALFPLVYKSYISTAKMRLMKPEIDEIKAKYGDDMQKIQVENMKLYKSGGVNPLGGCIPMLLQLPILIAMFSFFPASFELRQEGLWWADDLSTYDSIWTFGKIPIIETIYGDHVSLFTLLMTISTLIYTRMNNQLTGVTGQMKWIGYLMPIIFLGVFNNYSAGLSYYYFLSNMVTFGQQYFIGKFVDEDKLHKQIQENKKKPEAQKKSKFQQKLEEMAQAKASNGTPAKKPGPARRLKK